MLGDSAREFGAGARRRAASLPIVWGHTDVQLSAADERTSSERLAAPRVDLAGGQRVVACDARLGLGVRATDMYLYPLWNATEKCGSAAGPLSSYSLRLVGM